MSNKNSSGFSENQYVTYFDKCKSKSPSYQCKISVIIPVWNVEEYLSDCLESILVQKECVYEIICIDDYSHDSSGQILRDYQKYYPDLITIISQHHIGLSAARNRGLKIARGEYIYFMDSDDILKPNAFERMLNVLENKKLDVLFFSFENFCLEKKLQSQYADRINSIKRMYSFSMVKTGKEAFCEFNKTKEYYVLVWAQFFKRSFLEEHKIFFYEGIEYEDQLFTFQVLYHAKRVFCITDVLYLKRIRSGSICTNALSINYLKSYYTTYSVIKNMLDNMEGDFLHYTLQLLESYKNKLRRKYSVCTESEKNIINDIQELIEICSHCE